MGVWYCNMYSCIVGWGLVMQYTPLQGGGLVLQYVYCRVEYAEAIHTIVGWGCGTAIHTVIL